MFFSKKEMMAPYAVKAHDVQIRRKTDRYGKKGTFMNNRGYFMVRRGADGKFAKAS